MCCEQPIRFRYFYIRLALVEMDQAERRGDVEFLQNFALGRAEMCVASPLWWKKPSQQISSRLLSSPWWIPGHLPTIYFSIQFCLFYFEISFVVLTHWFWLLYSFPCLPHYLAIKEQSPVVISSGIERRRLLICFSSHETYRFSQQ